MTISTACGVFGKTSSTSNGATQDVTLSFTPKAVIVWTMGGVATGITNGDIKTSFGMSDGTNNVTVDGWGSDNVATAVEKQRKKNTACIEIINSGAVAQITASITFASNKFTVTWDLNVAGYTDLQICYIAYGGDDITGVEVGSFTKPTTSPAPFAQTVTCSSSTVKNAVVGKAMVLMIGAGSVAGGANSVINIGMTEGTNAGCVCNSRDDGNATAESNLSHTSLKFYQTISPTTSTILDDADFAGFNSSGFDLTWTTTDGSALVIYYIIIKGGKWEVGNGTFKTSTGTQAYTTSFYPKSIFMLGTQRTTNGSSGADTSFNISACDSDNQISAGVSADHGSDPTAYGTWVVTNQAIRACTVGDPPTIESEATFSSFNATDFTLNWGDASADAKKISWLVAGSSGIFSGVYKPKLPFWEIEGTDEDEIIG